MPRRTWRALPISGHDSSRPDRARGKGAREGPPVRPRA
jgi:hypothetical protein